MNEYNGSLEKICYTIVACVGIMSIAQCTIKTDHRDSVPCTPHTTVIPEGK